MFSEYLSWRTIHRDEKLEDQRGNLTIGKVTLGQFTVSEQAFSQSHVVEMTSVLHLSLISSQLMHRGMPMGQLKAV